MMTLRRPRYFFSSQLVCCFLCISVQAQSSCDAVAIQKGVLAKEGNSMDPVLRERMLGEVVRACPEQVDTVVELAGLQAKNGDPARAARTLAGALPYKRDPRILSMMGTLQQQAGDPASAKVSLQQALQLNPNDVEASLTLGVLALREGDLESARRYLTQVVSVDPRRAEGFLNLGVVEERSEHLDAALSAFKKAAELDPSSGTAQLNLAGALERQGAVAEASAVLDRAKALLPNEPKVYRIAALLAVQQKDFKKGAEAWKRVVELAPSDMGARVEVGLCQGRAGALDEAVRTLRDVVARDSKNSKAYAALGWAELSRGRYAAAVSSLKQALVYDPANQTARDNLKIAEQKLGK